MDTALTGGSPGTSGRVFSPSCSSTPGQDSTSGVIVHSDLELSTEDAQEEQTVDEFVSEGCGCQYGPQNSQCSSFLTKETIEACRQDSMELTKDELDLVVLAQIRAHRTSENQPTLYASNHSTGGFRPQSDFYVNGIQVCRTTFLFVHCMSRFRYNNLVKHYEDTGLTTRVHGNAKRLPANAFTHESVTKAVTFVKNYARAHAMPLPGRLPGHRDKVMVLPSDVTKIVVYKRYKEACAIDNSTAMGTSKFYAMWNELLPHISISKPSSDLCFTCQQNNLAIQQSACLPEEEKESRIQVAQDHLQRARTERQYYNDQVKNACTAWKESNNGATTPSKGHYSYDFAQQVHIPFDAQQTGPEYFKTARKCGIFGVCNDGSSKQVNYLIDEAENPGKGADCVISLLHHFLETHGKGEKDVHLHADNCTAQNKNNATIHYLMWRVMTQRQEMMELSFMLVGHTKFSPDRFFGIFKKAFRRSAISSLPELVRVVERSTQTGQNIPQLIREVGGRRLVTFYQWTSFLSRFFRSIPDILSYHNFKVKAQNPGIVFLRKFSDSQETTFDILKPDAGALIPSQLPELTVVKGLDLTRQWYLYEQIRPHCKSTLAADLTCPLPTQPKPTATAVSVTQRELNKDSRSEQSGSGNDKGQRANRKRCCSVCHLPGHTKRTCPRK